MTEDLRSRDHGATAGIPTTMRLTGSGRSQPLMLAVFVTAIAGQFLGARQEDGNVVSAKRFVLLGDDGSQRGELAFRDGVASLTLRDGDDMICLALGKRLSEADGGPAYAEAPSAASLVFTRANADGRVSRAEIGLNDRSSYFGMEREAGVPLVMVKALDSRTGHPTVERSYAASVELFGESREEGGAVGLAALEAAADCTRLRLSVESAQSKDESDPVVHAECTKERADLILRSGNKEYSMNREETKSEDR